MKASSSFAALLEACPVVLAPMEDVSDAPFRRVCRSYGAHVCVTEFVRAEQVIVGARRTRRKMSLAVDDRPTAIQIYGADAGRLLEAARIAETAAPTYIDINCGCWVPRVTRGGAGAAWLQDPSAMVAMAGAIVRAVDLPVTVKTRIGWGPESHMPIVDLARRLEDVGVAGIAIHCRTARMGHAGPANWTWAARARAAVDIPVIVNGDVRTPADVARALDETGCAGVMIGRGAINAPWIFREARSLLRDGEVAPGPTEAERLECYRKLLVLNVNVRGEKAGVAVTRRHLPLLGESLQVPWRARLCAATTLAATLSVIDEAIESLFASGDCERPREVA
jgi:nifR3 family TIM-barrel protein